MAHNERTQQKMQMQGQQAQAAGGNKSQGVRKHDPIQVEIAGFAENQAYGFGTNTMTEAGKSNLIFGGLGACFVLLIAGYGLN